MGNKSKSKKELKVTDPRKQVNDLTATLSKYKLGEKGVPFHEIRSLKPVFAFDYLSLDGTNLCYNCQSLITKDYVGFLEGLKKISQITYNDLKTIPNYRFHTINFEEHKISISKKDFRKIFTSKEESLSDEELPTLYQFDLHYVQEARACGFLYKGIFYLVWFDRNHIIYPSKK